MYCKATDCGSAWDAPQTTVGILATISYLVKAQILMVDYTHNLPLELNYSYHIRYCSSAAQAAGHVCFSNIGFLLRLYSHVCFGTEIDTPCLPGDI